jgi:cell division protein FtsB
MQMQNSRRPRLILILLLALCAVFVYSYTSRLQEKAEVEAQIVVMQANIDMARNRQVKLKEELEFVRSPEFLDQKARDEFGLAKPGDTVITLIQPAHVAAAPVQSVVEAAAVAAEKENGLPIWQQWMTIFSTESLRLDKP